MHIAYGQMVLIVYGVVRTDIVAYPMSTEVTDDVLSPF